MEELHKLYVGIIAVMIIFTIMFGVAAEIQRQNQVHLDMMIINQ